MKLSFNGCDTYHRGDSYRFTDRFDLWREKELTKRIPNSEAFVKKHGKGLALPISFRAPRNRRKPNLLGPSKDWMHWTIELPSFRFKSPDAKTYVPLMRQF